MRLPRIITLLATLACGFAACAQSNLSIEPVALLGPTSEKLGIEIFTATATSISQTNHGSIECEAPDPSSVEVYAALLAEELSRYPPSLVQRAELERVVLCVQLSFDGQLRTAVPDFGEDTLYLDIERGVDSPAYQRECIHHEFFHIVDYLDDGELYGDSDWSALNHEDFAYGTGGINAQERTDTGLFTDRYPGFLNHYSTTGVEEDKAEIFANLLIHPTYVYDRAETDAVLRAKANRMKQLVAEFCPAVTEAFWN